MKQHIKGRHRGITLTIKGWDELQTALSTAELNENAGNSFTLEELGTYMGLALNTVSKIIGRVLIFNYISVFVLINPVIYISFNNELILICIWLDS